jgi:hypothetical protein
MAQDARASSSLLPRFALAALREVDRENSDRRWNVSSCRSQERTQSSGAGSKKAQYLLLGCPEHQRRGVLALAAFAFPKRRGRRRTERRGFEARLGSSSDWAVLNTRERTDGP